MLTYKRKLILTKEQQSRIDSWINICRMIYNLGLEIRISAYRNKQSSVHKYELMKQITQIRNEYDWIKDAPVGVLQNVIIRLDFSYKKFFKGGGFPRWANKKEYKSISFGQIVTIKINENSIIMPKIGFLKMVKDSPVMGNIKAVTIVREVAGYFICITTDAVKDIQNKDESQIVGLDMGLRYLYVDSNGNFIDNPKHFKIYERQLRVANRSLARKKKGGNSWKRQIKRLALLHNKITNVRKDFLHKESTNISKRYSTVCLEDLNVKGMSRSRSLSKHILDCGWATFRILLEYKTNVIAINPKFTSQTCNDCGAKDAKSRISQSEFVCTSCGVKLNADENAAKNILGLGKALIRKREALACA